MRSSDRWLLRDVELDGIRLDCRLRAGRVAELGRDLPADPNGSDGERELRAGGGALLPGLADHHIHLAALAAARVSIDLDGAITLDDAPDADGSGWLRVIGAGAELTRADVDRRWRELPVRVQHRSGRLWTLNSVAVRELAGGLTATERATGQLWDADPRLRTLLDARGASSRAPLRDVGDALAAHGITHVSDATPDATADDIAALRGEVPQHVGSMAAPGELPRKLVLSDAQAPDLQGLIDTIASLHATGRPVAIHTVTAATLALALAALAATGTLRGDRLEHVAVCDDDAADRIAQLGLTVVTQPTIFARRGARFLDETPPDERPLLWRHASLQRRGVRVAVSSDAPYGDPDPGVTLAACAGRPGEGVPPADALATMLSHPDDPAGPPRTIAVGAPADLCVLRGALRSTLDTAAAARGWPVVAAFVEGRAVFRASPTDRSV